MKMMYPPLKFAVPTAILLMAVVAGVVAHRHYTAISLEEAVATLTSRASVVGNLIVSQLKGANLSPTNGNSRSIIDYAAEDADLLVAAVLDEQGKVFVSNSRELTGAAVERTPFSTYASWIRQARQEKKERLALDFPSQQVIGLFPLSYTLTNGQAMQSKSGVLGLIYDLAPTQTAVNATVSERTRTLAIILTLTAVVIWFFLKYSLLDRLNSLVGATRKIAEGRFSTPARLAGGDELGQMSQALDQMAAWLENSTAALRDSEKGYRELVETSNDLIWSLDAQGRWAFVNAQAAIRIYGYKPQEMLGRPFADFAFSDLDKKGAQSLKDINKDKQQFQFETMHRRKDGSSVLLSFNVIVVRDQQGKLRGTTGTATDITERRRAEEQIREQANLLNLAHDAIIALDLEDRVLFWNKGAESLYGWTRDELIGAKLPELLYKDATQVARSREAVLRDGEWMGELRQVGRGGSEIVVSSRWTLVRDDAGQPKSILTINTDITDKKNLEAQFFRAQRMEGIGTLASGIAHDLNNVLTPILLSLLMMRRAKSQEQILGLLNTLEISTQRGSDIVKQLLTFARGVKGEMILLQPAHVVKELVKIVRGTFPKSIQVQTYIPSNTWAVVGDATQLHQVLLNLCVNARDAMPEGGNLLILVENVNLDEHFVSMHPEAKTGPYVTVEVTDTGHGIPQTIIDKIFDPFFTTKEPGKGTGLGLSTALGIVKSHGGFLTLKSRADKGTTFKIFLPASPAAHARDGTFEAELPPPGNGQLVLIVDDEQSIREVTCKTLEMHGYRTLGAGDGQEALALYAQHENEIQVVVSDIMMPVMDGVKLIRALKRKKPQLPVIVSTGQSDNERLADLRGLGVTQQLDKPYTAEKLLVTLCKVLSGSS